VTKLGGLTKVFLRYQQLDNVDINQQILDFVAALE